MGFEGLLTCLVIIYLYTLITGKYLCRVRQGMSVQIMQNYANHEVQITKESFAAWVIYNHVAYSYWGETSWFMVNLAIAPEWRQGAVMVAPKWCPSSAQVPSGCLLGGAKVP